jgi:hypothetical protein
VLFRCPNPVLIFGLAVYSCAAQSPERIVVTSVADLQACVDRPAGGPLICALRSSASPYQVSGAGVIIRRSNTTVEGAAEAGQDPPTLKRTDASLKKLLWIQKPASDVTIRNLQLDGNSTLVPDAGFQDLAAEGSNITVTGVHFGHSASLAMFFNGPHFLLRDNVLGKLIIGGQSTSAPGTRPGRTAILGWGPRASEFKLESNEVSNYNGAINVNDVPGGTDPAQAGIIENNKLYHNSICVPNCGGGQIYLFGKTTNVKLLNNTLDGGWAESTENRDELHNYGIEVDGASYIYTSSNKIYNHSISGFWIGNGAHHITLENDTVYNNGLDGVQIAGNGRLAAVSSVSILGITSQHNDQHRSPRAPYPTLPRFFGVMIQNNGGSGICIQGDSKLGTNARGDVYAESSGSYSRAPACPRPYN